MFVERYFLSRTIVVKRWRGSSRKITTRSEAEYPRSMAMRRSVSQRRFPFIFSSRHGLQKYYHTHVYTCDDRNTTDNHHAIFHASSSNIDHMKTLFFLSLMSKTSKIERRIKCERSKNITYDLNVTSVLRCSNVTLYLRSFTRKKTLKFPQQMHYNNRE